MTTAEKYRLMTQIAPIEVLAFDRRGTPYFHWMRVVVLVLESDGTEYQIGIRYGGDNFRKAVNAMWQVVERHEVILHFPADGPEERYAYSRVRGTWLPISWGTPGNPTENTEAEQ
ncbi:hypothetical protein A2215_00245 [Candidatus Berkelbacteria bacterium RIFOXYA2_FULL_43_10]|uniref:Uncharacterized protein n=1 Tax=Candidatus Berkelbacteria bacterium RIFOXYA2_FULL_43_10 TaxID=1797472 RepID=A0A1F5ED52_9BACT|nr:MAG: hypothetical protein A2215_00245 [Candidatus Berkelbacteria bacterium RIFOXYA2_FULL_43_10]